VEWVASSPARARVVDSVASRRVGPSPLALLADRVLGLAPPPAARDANVRSEDGYSGCPFLRAAAAAADDVATLPLTGAAAPAVDRLRAAIPGMELAGVASSLHEALVRAVRAESSAWQALLAALVTSFLPQTAGVRDGWLAAAGLRLMNRMLAGMCGPPDTAAPVRGAGASTPPLTLPMDALEVHVPAWRQIALPGLHVPPPRIHITPAHVATLWALPQFSDVRPTAARPQLPPLWPEFAASVHPANAPPGDVDGHVNVDVGSLRGTAATVASHRPAVTVAGTVELETAAVLLRLAGQQAIPYPAASGGGGGGSGWSTLDGAWELAAASGAWRSAMDSINGVDVSDGVAPAAVAGEDVRVFPPGLLWAAVRWQAEGGPLCDGAVSLTRQQLRCAVAGAHAARDALVAAVNAAMPTARSPLSHSGGMRSAVCADDATGAAVTLRHAPLAFVPAGHVAARHLAPDASPAARVHVLPAMGAWDVLAWRGSNHAQAPHAAPASSDGAAVARHEDLVVAVMAAAAGTAMGVTVDMTSLARVATATVSSLDGSRALDEWLTQNAAAIITSPLTDATPARLMRRCHVVDAAMALLPRLSGVAAAAVRSLAAALWIAISLDLPRLLGSAADAAVAPTLEPALDQLRRLIASTAPTILSGDWGSLHVLTAWCHIHCCVRWALSTATGLPPQLHHSSELASVMDDYARTLGSAPAPSYHGDGHGVMGSHVAAAHEAVGTKRGRPGGTDHDGMASKARRLEGWKPVGSAPTHADSDDDFSEEFPQPSSQAAAARLKPAPVAKFASRGSGDDDEDGGGYASTRRALLDAAASRSERSRSVERGGSVDRGDGDSLGEGDVSLLSLLHDGAAGAGAAVDLQALAALSGATVHTSAAAGHGPPPSAGLPDAIAVACVDMMACTLPVVVRTTAVASESAHVGAAPSILAYVVQHCGLPRDGSVNQHKAAAAICGQALSFLTALAGFATHLSPAGCATAGLAAAACALSTAAVSAAVDAMCNSAPVVHMATTFASHMPNLASALHASLLQDGGTTEASSGTTRPASPAQLLQATLWGGVIPPAASIVMRGASHMVSQPGSPALPAATLLASARALLHLLHRARAGLKPIIAGSLQAVINGAVTEAPGSNPGLGRGRALVSGMLAQELSTAAGDWTAAVGRPLRQPSHTGAASNPYTADLLAATLPHLGCTRQATGGDGVVCKLDGLPPAVLPFGAAIADSVGGRRSDAMSTLRHPTSLLHLLLAVWYGVDPHAAGEPAAAGLCSQVGLTHALLASATPGQLEAGCQSVDKAVSGSAMKNALYGRRHRLACNVDVALHIALHRGANCHLPCVRWAAMPAIAHFADAFVASNMYARRWEADVADPTAADATLPRAWWGLPLPPALPVDTAGVLCPLLPSSADALQSWHARSITIGDARPPLSGVCEAAPHIHVGWSERDGMVASDGAVEDQWRTALWTCGHMARVAAPEHAASVMQLLAASRRGSPHSVPARAALASWSGGYGVGSVDVAADLGPRVVPCLVAWLERGLPLHAFPGDLLLPPRLARTVDAAEAAWHALMCSGEATAAPDEPVTLLTGLTWLPFVQSDVMAAAVLAAGRSCAATASAPSPLAGTMAAQLRSAVLGFSGALEAVVSEAAAGRGVALPPGVSTAAALTAHGDLPLIGDGAGSLVGVGELTADAVSAAPWLHVSGMARACEGLCDKEERCNFGHSGVLVLGCPPLSDASLAPDPNPPSGGPAFLLTPAAAAAMLAPVHAVSWALHAVSTVRDARAATAARLLQKEEASWAAAVLAAARTVHDGAAAGAAVSPEGDSESDDDVPMASARPLQAAVSLYAPQPSLLAPPQQQPAASAPQPSGATTRGSRPRRSSLGLRIHAGSRASARRFAMHGVPAPGGGRHRPTDGTESPYSLAGRSIVRAQVWDSLVSVESHVVSQHAWRLRLPDTAVRADVAAALPAIFPLLGELCRLGGSPSTGGGSGDDTPGPAAGALLQLGGAITALAAAGAGPRQGLVAKAWSPVAGFARLLQAFARSPASAAADDAGVVGWTRALAGQWSAPWALLSSLPLNPAADLATIAATVAGPLKSQQSADVVAMAGALGSGAPSSVPTVEWSAQTECPLTGAGWRVLTATSLMPRSLAPPLVARDGLSLGVELAALCHGGGWDILHAVSRAATAAMHVLQQQRDGGAAGIPTPGAAAAIWWVTTTAAARCLSQTVYAALGAVANAVSDRVRSALADADVQLTPIDSDSVADALALLQVALQANLRLLWQLSGLLTPTPATTAWVAAAADRPEVVAAWKGALAVLAWTYKWGFRLSDSWLVRATEAGCSGKFAMRSPVAVGAHLAADATTRLLLLLARVAGQVGIVTARAALTGALTDDVASVAHMDGVSAAAGGVASTSVASDSATGSTGAPAAVATTVGTYLESVHDAVKSMVALIDRACDGCKRGQRGWSASAGTLSPILPVVQAALHAGQHCVAQIAHCHVAVVRAAAAWARPNDGTDHVALSHLHTSVAATVLDALCIPTPCAAAVRAHVPLHAAFLADALTVQTVYAHYAQRPSLSRAGELTALNLVSVADQTDAGRQACWPSLLAASQLASAVVQLGATCAEFHDAQPRDSDLRAIDVAAAAAAASRLSHVLTAACEGGETPLYPAVSPWHLHAHLEASPSAPATLDAPLAAVCGEAAAAATASPLLQRLLPPLILQLRACTIPPGEEEPWCVISVPLAHRFHAGAVSQPPPEVAQWEAACHPRCGMWTAVTAAATAEGGWQWVNMHRAPHQHALSAWQPAAIHTPLVVVERDTSVGSSAASAGHPDVLAATAQVATSALLSRSNLAVLAQAGDAVVEVDGVRMQPVPVNAVLHNPRWRAAGLDYAAAALSLSGPTVSLTTAACRPACLAPPAAVAATVLLPWTCAALGLHPPPLSAWLPSGTHALTATDLPAAAVMSRYHTVAVMQGLMGGRLPSAGVDTQVLATTALPPACELSPRRWVPSAAGRALLASPPSASLRTLPAVLHAALAHMAHVLPSTVARCCSEAMAATQTDGDEVRAAGAAALSLMHNPAGPWAAWSPVADVDSDLSAIVRGARWDEARGDRLPFHPHLAGNAVTAVARTVASVHPAVAGRLTAAALPLLLLPTSWHPLACWARSPPTVSVVAIVLQAAIASVEGEEEEGDGAGSLSTAVADGLALQACRRALVTALWPRPIPPDALEDHGLREEAADQIRSTAAAPAPALASPPPAARLSLVGSLSVRKGPMTGEGSFSAVSADAAAQSTSTVASKHSNGLPPVSDGPEGLWVGDLVHSAVATALLLSRSGPLTTPSDTIMDDRWVRCGLTGLRSTADSLTSTPHPWSTAAAALARQSTRVTAGHGAGAVVACGSGGGDWCATGHMLQHALHLASRDDEDVHSDTVPRAALLVLLSRQVDAFSHDQLHPAPSSAILSAELTMLSERNALWDTVRGGGAGAAAPKGSAAHLWQTLSSAPLALLSVHAPQTLGAMLAALQVQGDVDAVTGLVGRSGIVGRDAEGTMAEQMASDTLVDGGRSWGDRLDKWDDDVWQWPQPSPRFAHDELRLSLSSPAVASLRGASTAASAHAPISRAFEAGTLAVAAARLMHTLAGVDVREEAGGVVATSPTRPSANVGDLSPPWSSALLLRQAERHIAVGRGGDGQLQGRIAAATAELAVGTPMKRPAAAAFASLASWWAKAAVAWAQQDCDTALVCGRLAAAASARLAASLRATGLPAPCDGVMHATAVLHRVAAWLHEAGAESYEAGTHPLVAAAETAAATVVPSPSLTRTLALVGHLVPALAGDMSLVAGARTVSYFASLATTSSLVPTRSATGRRSGSLVGAHAPAVIPTTPYQQPAAWLQGALSLARTLHQEVAAADTGTAPAPGALLLRSVTSLHLAACHLQWALHADRVRTALHDDARSNKGMERRRVADERVALIDTLRAKHATTPATDPTRPQIGRYIKELEAHRAMDDAAFKRRADAESDALQQMLTHYAAFLRTHAASGPRLDAPITVQGHPHHAAVLLVASRLTSLLLSLRDTLHGATVHTLGQLLVTVPAHTFVDMLPQLTSRLGSGPGLPDLSSMLAAAGHGAPLPSSRGTKAKPAPATTSGTAASPTAARPSVAEALAAVAGWFADAPTAGTLHPHPWSIMAIVEFLLLRMAVAVPHRAVQQLLLVERLSRVGSTRPVDLAKVAAAARLLGCIASLHPTLGAAVQAMRLQSDALISLAHVPVDAKDIAARRQAFSLSAVCLRRHAATLTGTAAAKLGDGDLLGDGQPLTWLFNPAGGLATGLPPLLRTVGMPMLTCWGNTRLPPADPSDYGTADSSGAAPAGLPHAGVCVAQWGTLRRAMPSLTPAPGAGASTDTASSGGAGSSGGADRVYTFAATGITAPKVLVQVGDDGRPYKTLVKWGEATKGADDMRQDAVMQQLFMCVNRFLSADPAARARGLRVRPYIVTPLSPTVAVLEWVEGTLSMGNYLTDAPWRAHVHYYPADMTPAEARAAMAAVAQRSPEDKRAALDRVCTRMRPALHHFFLDHAHSPAAWSAARTLYSRSMAAASMTGAIAVCHLIAAAARASIQPSNPSNPPLLPIPSPAGYIAGIGDRHVNNILLDACTGEALHIDFGVVFEQVRRRRRRRRRRRGCQCVPFVPTPFLTSSRRANCCRCQSVCPSDSPGTAAMALGSRGCRGPFCAAARRRCRCCAVRRMHSSRCCPSSWTIRCTAGTWMRTSECVHTPRGADRA